MTRPEIMAALTEVFRDVFGDEALVLRPETNAADIDGWDSVKMVNIILGVEERFAIRVRSRDVDALRCVGDFVRLIETKTG